MARIDGYVRLVQKALPQSATPSVPVSDDHTDGTWTYRDIYDREIAINDDGVIYWRALDNIYEFQVSTQSDIYTIGATLSGSTAIFTRTDSATYSLDLSTFGNTINYSTDLSGSYASHSLVDKSYVDTQVASIGASASANRFALNVRNQTGATIYKGMVVYINGSTGNLPTIAKAQANTEATSAGTFGIVLNDITNNSDGIIVTAGTIDTLDTRTTATHPFTTNTLSDGDTLYLSPTTAGYITNVKPSAPNHLVYIGKVIRTSPTNGSIVYRIQNGYELNEIHDVAISGLTAGQILQYDGSLWRNGTQSVPGLSQVLSASNSTGDNWIEIDYTGSGSNGIRNNDPLDRDKKIEFSADGILSEVYGNITDNLSSINILQDNINLLSKSDTGAFPASESFIQIQQNGDIVINNSNTLNINSENMTITGQSGTFAGAQYDIDYSANYTNRSLVDKEYVDNKTAIMEDIVCTRHDEIFVDATGAEYLCNPYVFPTPSYTTIRSYDTSWNATASMLIDPSTITFRAHQEPGYDSKVLVEQEVVRIYGGASDENNYTQWGIELGNEIRRYNYRDNAAPWGAVDKAKEERFTQHWKFSSSSGTPGTMDLWYENFEQEAINDYEVDFFIMNPDTYGPQRTYMTKSFKRRVHYDGYNTAIVLIPDETKKGDYNINPLYDSWDITIQNAGVYGNKYVLDWNLGNSYDFSVTMVVRWTTKKY